ncbi:hypothetical protein D3C83_237040 [compost metagenome]
MWGPVYGKHARAAVGIAELPRRAVVEVMGEFELWDESPRRGPVVASTAKRKKKKAKRAQGGRSQRRS